MFENEWFPKANAMGVSWKEFWCMNPHIIKLMLKGHEEKMKEQDYMNWLLGRYVAYALDSTVCNAWIWRKKGSKPHEYIEHPFTVEAERKSKPMTEKELRIQRELFVAKLQAMKTNFELNH